MIAFIRGIRTPAGTISASARIVSNRAGHLPVAIADQVFHQAAGVLKVHDQVTGGLSHPRRSGVGGRTEDSDPPGGMVDGHEEVEAGTGQGGRFEEVRGDDRVASGP
jgi:hypothetical protein